MTGWLAETLAGSTLLMLVVLALRGPVARAFGARWAYALWLIPALRWLVPPLPALLPKAALPPVVIFIPTTVSLAAPQPPAPSASWEWMPFLVALWAGGAVLFLTLQWLEYRVFLHRLRLTARPARPPSCDGIAILVSPEVEGPIALGLLHRRIVLPADFLRRYTREEQRLALEHELVHHRRGDMWCNLAALVLLALNWFNPVAWYAFRAFRSDQELACDAVVAARASGEQRLDYATALVKSASRPGLIAACPLTRAGQLKHRLRMMGRHRASRLRSLGGGSAVAALAAGAFAFGTPGFSHAPERAILYLPAPAPTAVARATPVAAAPAPAPAAAAGAAWFRPASSKGRHRAAARRHEPFVPAEPVALAAALPPEVPQVQLATLRLRMPHIPGQQVVRVVGDYPGQIRLFTTVLPSGGASGIEQKLEVVARILGQLDDNDADVADLKAALQRAHGQMKIKLTHTIVTEEGA